MHVHDNAILSHVHRNDSTCRAIDVTKLYEVTYLLTIINASWMKKKHAKPNIESKVKRGFWV